MVALLDVSEAFDPSFLDTIIVWRITEVVDHYGRARRYKTRFVVNNAVVIAASPADLQRAPDYQLMNKGLDIYCPTFRLQGPVRDPVSGQTLTHPDEIEWHNSMFVVDSASDFSNWGTGYVYTHCVSITAVDGPPEPSPSRPPVGIPFPPTMGTAD